MGQFYPLPPKNRYNLGRKKEADRSSVLKNVTPDKNGRGSSHFYHVKLPDKLSKICFLIFYFFEFFKFVL
nr:MAG TPA: hypothetical protein [Caudoviricetes sp.]